MKRILLSILAALSLAFTCAGQAPENIVRWKVSRDGDALVFTGRILAGWHVYGLGSEGTATTLELDPSCGAVPEGKPYAISETTDFHGEKVFFDKIVFGQKISVPEGGTVVKGCVSYQACNDGMCTPPIDWDFSCELTAAGSEVPSAEVFCDGPERGGSGADGNLRPANQTVIADPEAPEKDGGLWALILEAILWGLAMLLTPCVFPMVPMTVSFFMKGEENAAAGRFKALMYGLFIVLLYTVPISIIIILTRVIGGDAVTADIFNWLATHWLPNLIFFAVFMVFAASFFGAFEITLPSKWVNGSDSKAGKGSLGGIFFLALTLVLVSFSCTGPIVGTVLIKSTAGEFWTPMITMLAFSLAFALPFTLLAMFPSLLKKLPKSGGWLNSVKVVLGFIEVALGFKFLSVADQTYHWGILDREVYLAIWIVVFTMLGFYLLGKLRFKYDEKVEKISLLRLTLSIAVFSFVVYMIPGMWGAPLKALSGYLPPMETQDFILPNLADGSTYQLQQSGREENKYDLKMPLGLSGYFSLEEGLAAAKASGKPVFVDITGHGCVNCREMEQRVWSDPRVLRILREDYVLVALYTDDKTPLDKEDWVTTEGGKVLKDLGRANSYLVRKRFGVNAQPNYALLSPEGELLAPVRGYNLDVEDFLVFLGKGLE